MDREEERERQNTALCLSRSKWIDRQIGRWIERERKKRERKSTQLHQPTMRVFYPCVKSFLKESPSPAHQDYNHNKSMARQSTSLFTPANQTDRQTDTQTDEVL